MRHMFTHVMEVIFCLSKNNPIAKDQEATAAEREKIRTKTGQKEKMIDDDNDSVKLGSSFEQFIRFPSQPLYAELQT